MAVLTIRESSRLAAELTGGSSGWAPVNLASLGRQNEKQNCAFSASFLPQKWGVALKCPKMMYGLLSTGQPLRVLGKGSHLRAET